MEATSTIRLNVSGMHCGSCVGRIESLLREQPDVLQASANLANETATVTVGPDAMTPDALSQVLTGAGYPSTPTATTRDITERVDAREDRASRINLLLAVALTLPIFVAEMGGHFSNGFAHWIELNIGTMTSRWIQMVLSAVVLFVAGREFFSIGIPALLRRAPEMNSLVAIGASSAWLYSTVNTVFPGQFWTGRLDVYFESAAVIVTLILLGRYLESKAKGKTSQAITALARMQPDTALLEHDGQTQEVAIASLMTGDTILIKPGERIALDGQITAGSGSIDESMLTGEPMPVRRTVGDTVTGGTLNTDGALSVRVTATGSDTVLSRIIAMVQDAQGSKLPIQALVDKIAMWFVPAVLLIAALTFLVWYFVLPTENRFGTALIYAVSVLIIACPCAMGLATPMSIMVGIGRAARNGILFRHGQALQQLGQTELVAFDKTGTLTIGKPVLTEVQTLGEFTEEELLTLVGSLQSQSEHPIARAVLDAADRRGLSLTEPVGFVAEAGLGVSAMVSGRHVIAGNRRFLTDRAVDISALLRLIDQSDTPGQTTFMIAVDKMPAGVIKMADVVREQAEPTVSALKTMGLEIAVISGDRTETVQELAQQLDINHALGDVLPGQKQEQIRKLRGNGKKVAFVGDGINDAPALADADVGIAIGGGTDIAIESADLVLASSDLSAVTRGVLLSRATMRNIKQNLFWAFIYNLVLIPVAAGVLVPFTGVSLSPMLAAGAMSFSSVFVAINALRLNRINIDPFGLRAS